MIVEQDRPVVFAVGYSVRALVEACWYARLECVAIDHFGDADTRYFANQRWIELQLNEHGGLSLHTRCAIQTAVNECIESRTPTVFLFCGGMENWGAVANELREIGPVIGPTEIQRRQLRDIHFLRNVVDKTGLTVPPIQSDPVPDATWIWKPHASAGGLKIVRGDRANVEGETGYWQEFISGEQVGIGCLIDSSGYQIVGATDSFSSDDWEGPSEFIYRGSFGPISLDASSRSQVEALCFRVREAIGCVGWAQFDFIRDERGTLWLLECNPRWTAGMEVSLFASDVNPVQELLTANGFERGGSRLDSSVSSKYFAKAIVYAKVPLSITADMINTLNQLKGLADRPHLPQSIERGHPIATVRARLRCDEASATEIENRSRLLEILRKQATQVEDIVLSSQRSNYDASGIGGEI